MMRSGFLVLVGLWNVWLLTSLAGLNNLEDLGFVAFEVPLVFKLKVMKTGLA